MKVNKITEKDIIAAMLQGHTVLVGTVHTAVCEPLTVRDKKTEKSRVAHICKTTVLTEKDVAIVENWLPDDEKAEDWIGLLRGTRVACKVVRSEMRGGFRRVAGELAVLA